MYPLNNIFRHDTNTYHCVKVDISLENCEYFKGTPRCSKGALWGTALNKIQGD